MKLLDLIVCDDIRQEVSGKVSLIGVYSDLVIHFPSDMVQWPISLKIGLFIRFKLDDGEVIPTSFDINCFHNGAKFTNFAGNLTFPTDIKYFNLVLVNNAFPVPSTGEIVFEIVFQRKDGTIISIKPEYALKVTSNTVSYSA